MNRWYALVPIIFLALLAVVALQLVPEKPPRVVAGYGRVNR